MQGRHERDPERRFIGVTRGLLKICESRETHDRFCPLFAPLTRPCVCRELTCR